MKLIALFLAAVAAAIGTALLPGIGSGEAARHDGLLVQASARVDGNTIVQPLLSVSHREPAELDFGKVDGQSLSVELTPDLDSSTPFVTVSMAGHQDIILPVTGELQQIDLVTASGKPVTIRLGLNLNRGRA
ncbi:MAG: hypothetical protein QNJ40_12345 [Xanthomonadales bacterium]|nr:hypothetical protein [Xanthomonadales bacterium]